MDQIYILSTDVSSPTVFKMPPIEVSRRPPEFSPYTVQRMPLKGSVTSRLSFFTLDEDLRIRVAEHRSAITNHDHRNAVAVCFTEAHDNVAYLSSLY